jgi:uncharacterized protein involved in exopolysaccharide biosynthesis
MPNSTPDRPNGAEGGARPAEFTLLAIGNILLSRAGLIAALAIVFGIVVGSAALIRAPKYMSGATLVPQSSEGGSSDLALAASQFGIRIPATSGNTWGPALYIELLQSRAFLERVAAETVTVVEEAGRRAPLYELMNVPASASAEARADQSARTLGAILRAEELKAIDGVKLTVTTKWPSVSKQTAEHAVDAINEFILRYRKSQATAERAFIDTQVDSAERKLRDAELRLRDFAQSNRIISEASAARLQRDALEREVSLRTELFTSWMKSREDARIREVRDTPVITVLERPWMPVRPLGRKLVLSTLAGVIFGTLLGALIALLQRRIATARVSPSPDEREFFALADRALPRFMRRSERV